MLNLKCAKQNACNVPLATVCVFHNYYSIASCFEVAIVYRNEG